MPEITLIESLRQAMDEELARDPDVIVIGADIARRGGVYRATASLLDKYGPGRIIDAPPGGAAVVGVGIGAALYGMRPICEIQSADFIYPALNQIINEAAKICYRSNGGWTVPMVIRAPYGGGVGGGLYHSQSAEALLSHVPGLKVVIPAEPHTAKGLLKAAVRDPGPVIFLEPRRGYRSLRGEVPDEEYTLPLRVARITRPGSSLTAIAYGWMHSCTLEAAEKVAEQGVDVEVVDVQTLYPPPRASIVDSVRRTGKALIVHEDHCSGGYGAEIAAMLAEVAFANLDAPIRRICGPDIPAMPFSRPMQDWYMPDPDKIAAVMLELAAY